MMDKEKKKIIKRRKSKLPSNISTVSQIAEHVGTIAGAGNPILSYDRLTKMTATKLGADSFSIELS